MRTIGALLLVCAAGSAARGDDLDLLAQAAAKSSAGDHAGAAELYDRAYRDSGESDLLVLVGAEQGKAGHVDEALQSLCAYLTFEPSGTQAVLAVDQVAQLQASRGVRVDMANVCAPSPAASLPPFASPLSPAAPLRPPGAIPSVPSSPLRPPGGTTGAPSTTPFAPDAQPMLPPVAPQTFDRELPTTNSGLSQRQIAGIGVGAAGIAALGIGAIYAMRAQDISDDIGGHDPTTPWPSDIHEREVRGAHAETMASILFVSGAAAVASGAVLYLTGRPTREHIVVAPSGGGLSVRGAF